MGKTITNLATVLGLIVIGIGGYYFYNEHNASIDFTTNDATMQAMLDNANTFIGYNATLRSIEMNTSLFDDPRFQSLQSYSTPIQEQQVGRSDPFGELWFSRTNASSE
ncbi:hypothetical protein KC906_01280 [Candidatus Kaiserbacteria bacterium]|nr:hypothetical protein [Candidatus Kaiserbacteria bacterium]MCB9812174.1 hypothetical protein [Candidatus Nomurabacteria bacterium]